MAVEKTGMAVEKKMEICGVTDREELLSTVAGGEQS